MVPLRERRRTSPTQLLLEYVLDRRAKEYKRREGTMDDYVLSRSTLDCTAFLPAAGEEPRGRGYTSIRARNSQTGECTGSRSSN